MLRIQLLLILLLMYMHPSQQQHSNNNNKLWLNENNKQQATSNHHQYLYVLNDTQTINDAPSSQQTSARDQRQPEEVLEASESRLSLNLVSGRNATNNTLNSASSKQDRSVPKSTQKPNTNANSKKFFKNPSKLSISSLLTKSKRQDMLPDPKAKKPRQARKLPSKNQLTSQSRSFHLGQPFVPYATGSHHLLFGSQLPMVDFYGHFTAHPGAEMITGTLVSPPQPPTSTIHHLNAQFQTQQTMPRPQFHQSMGPLTDFRPSSGGLAPTIFFPAPSTKSNPTETTNSTSKLSSTNTARHQQQQSNQQQQKNKESGGGGSGNNGTSHHSLSLPLGAAAAALISERAKSFISHLNRGGLVGSNRKKENTKETKTSSPEPAKVSNSVPVTSASLTKAMPHEDVGLASMMKNAADTWAGASTSSEVAPSILVEHDGPTITTVNFDQHHNLNGPISPHQRPTYDDDDDVNSYYETNEEEESEVGGSHDARRFVRFRGASHQQPNHPTHHNPYIPGHSLGTLRHISQPRHVPYPPRYPHSRYPFEQQVQSHNIHTEVPYEPFSSSYGIGPQTLADYGEMSRKKGYSSGGEFPQAALQDYLRQQRLIDQPQIYPDSINAIKEQNNGDAAMDKFADLTSNIGSKLSASNSDQIDQLIKELQELNKIKRNQSMDSSSSNGRDSSDSGNQRRVKLSQMDTVTDYEDSFWGSGGTSDDDDDEKFKVLRKKLLNRLRNKARGGRRGNNNAEDSFHSEAIKIPLHTLLLAALDRRMSPSEARSQSVVSTASETGGGSSGEGQHQRKWLDSAHSGSLVNTLALSRQQDFNEITSGLGSLLTTLDEGTATHSDTPANQFLSSDGSSESRTNGFGHEFGKTPQLNQSSEHLSEYQAPPQTPSMFILNNIRLPDQLSIERGTNESALKSTIETSLELIRKAQNESSLDDQLFSNPTTRAPGMRDSGESAAGKKRRQVQQQQEDYDEAKQEEEFTRDVRTGQLELVPEWATRKASKLESAKRAHQEASSRSSVHFDDDSDLSGRSRAASARAGNTKRRRKSGAAHQRDASTIIEGDDATDFLNKLQLETEMNADSHVEDPIGLASQDELNKRDVNDELLNEPANSSALSSDANDNDLELEPVQKGRSGKKDEDAESGLWKRQVIDEEVSRLERLAAGKRKAAGDKANPNDYQDDSQMFED